MEGRAEYETKKNRKSASETVHAQVRIQVEVRNALKNHA